MTAEPVYANNRPEHYAVSAKFPQSQTDTGAIAKTPRPLGPGLPDTPKASEVLLGAIGNIIKNSLKTFFFNTNFKCSEISFCSEHILVIYFS